MMWPSAGVSGAVVTMPTVCAAASRDAAAQTVARDVALFEQRGCLSPHHVFVHDQGGGEAHAFGARLATTLRDLSAASITPATRIALADAAAIRGRREHARWRALGGHPVTLWEGSLPGWAVIYDHDAAFSVSPGYRTVTVSPYRDSADLGRRLEPVAGRIEAFACYPVPAIDQNATAPCIRQVLKHAGATWICAAGRIQSPPLDWPHGGGAFLRSLRT
jgi:hypothetical protein